MAPYNERGPGGDQGLEGETAETHSTPALLTGAEASAYYRFRHRVEVERIRQMPLDYGMACYCGDGWWTR
jgi:hypothetical protein